jgi:hypothetical protein
MVAVVVGAAPAYASSTVSVTPTRVMSGDLVTIRFTATRTYESADSGMGLYTSNSRLGSLDSFTTVVTCHAPVAGPCVQLPGVGWRVPTGHVALGRTVSGYLTLQVKPGTRAGTFPVRYQFGGDETRTGPTVTVVPCEPYYPVVTPFLGPPLWCPPHRR